MIKITINDISYNLLAFTNTEAIYDNGKKAHWNSVKWVTIPYTVSTPHGLADILGKENWAAGGDMESEIFMNKNCFK